MEIRRAGKQTWLFPEGVGLLATAAVCGPREGEGPLSGDFDHIFPDLRMGQDSFEKAEQYLGETAVRRAISKAALSPDDIDIFFAGDLINQITPAGFTARSLGVPYFGLFAACATIGESLALAALTVASGVACRTAAMASSHTCTAEKQFRYPNEYGSQKPPYSQSTASLAGAAVLAAEPAPVRLTAVTIGRVCDEKITDPFQMGAAMAPAFADTLITHLQETASEPWDYDLILSGDLGRVGQGIAWELLVRRGVNIRRSQLGDCGLLLLGGDDKAFSGCSGCGCAAGVGMGHICRRIREGELKRVLLCPTGALLSPLAVQQKESIPAICHAIVLERG